MHHGDVSPEIAAGLLALKKRVEAARIPPSQLDQTINVAIWNIREFGRKRRTLPALHYIAEILGQFDLIALVELRDDLTDFGRVCDFLGPSWDLVYSDWMPDSRGKKDSQFLAPQSFWRAPCMCSFRAGNFDFFAIATHARWGDSLAGREAELGMLADWIDSRVKDKSVDDTDLIVMGDFNTPKLDDKLFKALTRRGLQVPDSLLRLTSGDVTVGGSNLNKDARYDQILHLPSVKKRFTNFGGMLDFHISDARIKELFPGKGYTRTEFTYQLSDHFPVWVQIKTDIEGERLTQIVQNAKKG